MSKFPWTIHVELDDVPEFNLPAAVGRSLFCQLHGGEISVDTQLGNRGRYETRVIYDFRLLDTHYSRTWAEAQITHQMTALAWGSAQRWICTHCGSSSWAAAGQAAQCYTPQCPGEELCAQCTPWHKCEAHH